jgi:hypothetical protein
MQMFMSFKCLDTLFLCRGVLCSLATGLLTCCASFKSRPAQVADKDDGRAVTGLHYFLPKGRIQIVGAKGAGNAYTLAITRVLEADREQRYRLRQTSSVFHNDTHTYEVNEKGLIASLNTVNTSKVETIVVNLADTVIDLAKIALNATKMGSTVVEKKVLTDVQPFQVIFDPYELTEINAAVKVAENAGFILEAEHLRRSMKQDARKPHLDPWTHEVAASEAGVCYRPCTTARVTLRMEPHLGHLLRSTEVAVPDLDDVAVFSLKRGVFATKTEAVTFADGEITNVEMTRPSEALEFTKIPLTVTTKALSALKELPALGELLWKPAAEPNADIKAQTARLKAENERLKAEQALQEQAAKNQALKDGH